MQRAAIDDRRSPQHRQQVYVTCGRPLFVLSEAQKEEIIAQADSRLKTAKGRGYGRQVTRAEVVQLLAGLPRDESNMVSFHDAQRVIIDYREEQIDRFRLVFPDLVCRNRDEKPSSSSVKASSTKNTTPQQGNSAVVSRGSQGSRPDGKTKTPAVGTRTPAEGDSPTACGAGVQLGRGKRAHKKFSPDVAPADMFVKDVGYTPAGLANHVRTLRFGHPHEYLSKLDLNLDELVFLLILSSELERGCSDI